MSLLDRARRGLWPKSLLFWLLAATVFPMWQFMAGREVYFLSDALHQHYPFQQIIGRLLAEDPSSLPLWNPYLFSGSPLAADPQMQVWYPPAVLYRLLPYPVANGCFLALHLALAVVGMAWFLRAQGLGSCAAALGGIGFGLGSQPTFLLVVPPALCVYAWLPWVALFTSRLAASRATRDAVGLGIVGAWMLLAGSPPYLVYAAVLSAVIMFTGHPLSPALGGRGKGEGGKFASLWRQAGLAAGVAAATAAMMLVPFMAYLRESSRGVSLPLSMANAEAMPPWGLLGLLAPQGLLPRSEEPMLGMMTAWTSLHYVGVLLVVLAVTGWVLLRRTGVTRTPVVLVLLGVALGLGAWLPGGALILSIPPFSFMRHPGLWMSLAVFGVAWLGAQGAEELERRLMTRAGRQALQGWAVAVVFLVCVSIGSKLWKLGILKRWLQEGGVPVAIDLASRLGSAIYPAVWIGLGVLVLWLASRKEIPVRRAFALLAVLVWLDLLILRHQVQPSARAAWIMEPSVTERFFDKEVKPDRWFRVFVTPRHQENLMDEGEGRRGVIQNVRASLRSSLPAVSGLRDAGGNNPLRPARLETLLDQAVLAPKPWAAQAAAVFRLLGVKYLITRSDLNGPGYRLVHDGYTKVYERLGEVRPVWVEPAAHGTVKGPVNGQPGAWEFRVKLRKPATVVVSETWLPGWKLAVPLAGVQVKPVHDALIGVELPAGEHQVRLRYDPPAVKAGMAVSLLALTGLIVFGGLSLLRS